MNALIIIDPQNDFITGTLPVPGAAQAMRRLAEKIVSLPVSHVFVTMDCHPYDHMSFKENGGIWPAHCVKYSEGAAIEPVLMEALRTDRSKNVCFIEKGRDSDKEEYSAFEVGYPSLLDSADRIYITGLAGDVCVQTSIRDLAKLGLKDKLVIVPDASPSLDGGQILGDTIGELGLKTAFLGEI